MMNVLVTGAYGFIGRNLCEALDALSAGYDRRPRYAQLKGVRVLRAGRHTSADELADLCREASFVFHIAGANRVNDPVEFQAGNVGATQALLQALEAAGNACPVMLASSVQAAGEGRFAGSAYGASKRRAEELVSDHAHKTGAPAYVFRFPNVFGKWCRPNYNSVVATFCANAAQGKALQVNDPSVELELLYVDDLVQSMLDLLVGACAPNEDGVCRVKPTYRRTVGQLAQAIRGLAEADPRWAPCEPRDSFAWKLRATYLSYLPIDQALQSLQPHEDERGSFTELVRTQACGQVSVNVVKPGFAKGNHWHHSKWERFCVVSGTAVVILRCIGPSPDGRSDTVRFTLSGSNPQMVTVPPGYAHRIENPSTTQDAVLLIWANETFDAEAPDTFYREV